MKKSKELFLIGVMALLTMASDTSYASLINDSETIETVGVFVRDLKICHQHEWRHLSVNLEYAADIGGKAENVQLVKEHIRTFLEDYSNSDDFWEVMNTNLVHSLVESFPDMVAIRSTFSVAPDEKLSFPRESIVHYERGRDTLGEIFKFTKLNYLICQDTFRLLDLHVSWELIPNPNPSTDYPDYQWVDAAMDQFFKEYPVSFSEWKTLKPMLTEYLLQQFPTMEFVDVEIIIVE